MSSHYYYIELVDAGVGTPIIDQVATSEAIVEHDKHGVATLNQILAEKLINPVLKSRGNGTCSH